MKHFVHKLEPHRSHVRTRPAPRTVARLALAAAALLAPSLACAQRADRPRPTDAECRQAAHVIERGHPAKKGDWAWLTIGACGGAAAGQAGAAVTRGLRTEADTAVLFDAVRPFWGLRDAALLDATLEVVRDPAASPAARIVGARSLLALVSGGSMGVSYGELTAEGRDCAHVFTSGDRARDGAPLAADYKTQVRTALSAIANATDAAAPLRSAAACVADGTR